MKVNLLRIPVLLAVLVLIVCTSVAAKERKTLLDGNVYSAETNQPVKDAAVKLRRESPKRPSAKINAATDDAGKFQVALQTGAYRYSITKAGFAIFEGTVTISGKEPIKLSIPLNKEGLVSGRIIDPGGTPLQGITVSAGENLSGVTDAQGFFRIGGMDVRGYEIQVVHPVWVAEKRVYLSLAAGEKKDLGDITVRKGGTLAVKLRAGSNGALQTVDRAEVYLSSDLAYRNGRTGKKGEIVFAALPPGFYTLGSYDDRIIDPRRNVEVKEGERTTIRLNAVIKPAELSLENSGQVVLPGSPLKLRLRGLWVDTARVTVYAVDTAQFLKGAIEMDNPDKIPHGSLRRVRTLYVALKAGRNTHYKRTAIRLPPSQPGIYLVEAARGKTVARASYIVTRLGIVAKASPAGTLLYAADLVDGRSVEGANMKALHFVQNGAAKPLFNVKTDKDGLVQLSGPRAGMRIIGQKGDNLAFLDLSPEENAEGKDRLKGYLYTERPAYRPGQTVYFKGILRARVGEGYALPQLDRVHVTVLDSGEQTVFEQDCAVNRSGSFNGSFALPSNPPLGGYTLKANADRQDWQTTFKVLEYRKPEFEATLAAAPKFCLGGDTEEVSLQARYYFGAPAAGAKVRYRIYSQPFYAFAPDDAAGQDSGDGEEENEYSAGYSDFVGEGTGTTDENGRLVIPVTTRQTDIPLTYIIETDITDAASRQVSASVNFMVVPSLIALEVHPHGYLARPGQPVDISATARTWEGKPVQAPIAVIFEEERFDKRTHTTSYRKIDGLEIRTDETGRGDFRYAFPRAGYWRITATTTDARGRKAAGRGWIWVWQEGHAWESSYRELEMEFDKRSYKPGETARLIIKNPAVGADLLLALEGREIYGSRVLKSDSSVAVEEIPVEKEYAPYVFVSATVIHNGRFYNRTKTLKVDYQPNRLNVTVKSDKPVYAPGEAVRLSVTSEEGYKKPCPAEFSLAVVDEAIYAVSPDRREDIYRFFRGTREHLVTTLHSFPRVYLGGGAKDQAVGYLAEDGLKGIKVRKTFKDTAFWLPVLTTDDRGRATAEFVLPDNLTTWRATAVGHSDMSDFGSGMEKFIARLDVMARLQPPRFFIQGDELKVPGMVNNMTDEDLTVNGRFEVEGLTMSGDGRFSGKVAARGVLRRDMTVKAGPPGLSLLRMRAAAGERGDAMELQVPVLSRAMKRASQGNIVLRGDSGETMVDLPAGALSEGAMLSVTLSPTLAASLNQSLRELVDFPYGCVEQTMSRFLPAVYVRHLLGSGRWTLDRDISDKLPLVIDDGLKRLYDFQHEDGGWGWWKEDAGDPYMTAYVLYGLVLARKAGVTVRPDVLERGTTALQGLMQRSSVDSLPFAYRSLTLAGKTDAAAEKKIEAAWRQLRSSERIFYVDALLNSGQRERAQSLLTALKGQVKREGSAAYLQDQDALSWWYSWRWGGSSVETTAMLLDVVLAFDPADPLAPSLAEFLVHKRSGRWWNTTRGTALVVKVLADYEAATGEFTSSYAARLLLNGREMEQLAIENGKIVKGRTTLEIPATQLNHGKNRLQLVKSVPEGVLYLAATLNYLVPPEQATQSPGLDIERKFYHIKPRRDGKDWRMEYLPLQPGESLAPGDEIEVRLVVDNRKEMNFVIIEDRLPAGFEVRETKTDPRFASLADYWDWYAHVERHDERMAFFLDLLPAGRHEFRYVIYPELEGRVLALPASIWPMYVPSLRSESKPWRASVTH